MKLCPQCAFIYEDVQTFCDMDGKELVSDSSPVVIAQSAPLTRLTISVPPKLRSRRVPILAMAGLVLAVLLAGLYFAQLKWRSTATESAVQAPSNAINPQTLPSDLVSSASAEETQSEQSPRESASPEDLAAISSASPGPALSQSPSFTAPVTRVGPVSSSGLSGGSHGPVLLRLTNGATIKADEAWQKKEGVWYRQGGVITFLKRSRVRAIERSGSTSPSKSSASNLNQRNQNVVAQNQPRAGKAEVVSVKKESRVSTFLKKTGRILKKPFRF